MTVFLDLRHLVQTLKKDAFSLPFSFAGDLCKHHHAERFFIFVFNYSSKEVIVACASVVHAQTFVALFWLDAVALNGWTYLVHYTVRSVLI